MTGLNSPEVLRAPGMAVVHITNLYHTKSVSKNRCFSEMSVKVNSLQLKTRPKQIKNNERRPDSSSEIQIYRAQQNLLVNDEFLFFLNMELSVPYKAIYAVGSSNHTITSN